jgi:hypothetical protein
VDQPSGHIGGGRRFRVGIPGGYALVAFCEDEVGWAWWLVGSLQKEELGWACADAPNWS